MGFRKERRPPVRAVLLCLLLALPLSAAGDGSGEKAEAGRAVVRLGVDPAAVERTGRPGEARDRLEALLPSAEGRLLLLGRPDVAAPFLFPLLRGGGAAKVDVVLPSGTTIGDEQVRNLLRLLEEGGVEREERGRFRLADGVFRGRVGTCAVAFAALPEFPPTTGPTVVLVETSILGDLYTSEAKTPVNLLAKRLLLTIRRSPPQATAVLLHQDAERPSFPLLNGFLAPLLRDLLAAPERWMTELPGKWSLFAGAEHDRIFSQDEEALSAFGRFLELEPGEPSTLLRISQIHLRRGDLDTALLFLDRTASADRAWRRGYAEMADHLAGQGRKDIAEEMLRTGAGRFPGDPLLASSFARLLLAAGEEALAGGDSEAAAARFREAASAEGADPSVRARARELLAPLPAERR